MTGALLVLLLAAAPARAEIPPTALVWIPAENFSRWSRVDDALRRRDDLKLTIALTPAMATPVLKDILGPWLAAGRVELAARIAGDPILPLVDARADDLRPDDALDRAADARREVERRMGAAPGIVVGGGALDASLAGPISNAGAAWVLVGPYDVHGASWAAAGKTVFAPARAAPHGPLLDNDLTAPGATAFDETGDADSALLAALAALPTNSRPVSGWATVSALAAAAPGPRADALSVAQWPGWDGAPAAQEPGARLAWNAYDEAAKALAQYQNSGTADLHLLEQATALLRRAQDARFYRAPSSGSAALPAELRARLLAFYRRLKTTAPEALYAVNPSTSASADEVPTGVHAASGPGWVAFDSPAGTLASAPAGAAGPESWRLRGLRVEWNDQRVLFRLFVGRIAPLQGPRPVYDVYIDLNHVVGAGSIRLLDGRGAFAAARDAWEYALTVEDKDARLWRASADGDPEELNSLETTADSAAGEVRVSVPREALRGNPAHWGYLALSLAEDPRRAGRSPAAPLADANGAVLRGLLAPLEAQKALFDHPGAAQRVPAARLDSTP